MLNKSFLLLVLITATITVTACSKTVITPKKALASVAFPKHPGTIKMVTMLDQAVKIKSIDDVSEWNKFIYYDNKNHKLDSKEGAVRAVPIVEVRMYSKDGDKLVPKDKASVIWIEMYDSDGNIIDTHTMWRGGVRGGKRKVK